MSLLRDFKEYMLEEEFKIVYFNNKLDVINYLDIISFDSNKIMIKYKNGKLNVSGNNLIISKLLKDELLIEGKILKIELGEI